MFKKKDTKGITLIALVITIIVLLILAGVTIAALSGDNGILKRAAEAKEQTKQKNDEETEKLAGYESTIEQYADGTNGGGSGNGGSGGGSNSSFTNINKSDSNPAGVMPASSTAIETDASKGIVIKDKNNNEWVWIEVPITTVFSDLTIDTTKELTEQNYTDIKNKLMTYATTYREVFIDEWYEGCGMTSEEYTTAYQKMLKSIYTYGGFWIGRYEAGIEGSIDDVSKARTAHADIIIGTSPKAISQKDAIPYNFVYCREAQALAKGMSPDSNYTSSLLFGIQWDLVCKFLEVKGGLTESDIKSNSTNWGNYTNVELAITSQKGKKSSDYGITWTVITGKKALNSSVLLTTGASNEASKMKIYDFAGNEGEWTLEHATTSKNYPCASRGGNYHLSGSGNSASVRNSVLTTYGDNFISFRPTFYVN